MTLVAHNPTVEGKIIATLSLQARFFGAGRAMKRRPPSPKFNVGEDFGRPLCGGPFNIELGGRGEQWKRGCHAIVLQ